MPTNDLPDNLPTELVDDLFNDLPKSSNTLPKFDAILCPHSTQCTGCQYWDLTYIDEIQLKKDLIKSKLKSSLDIVVKTPDFLSHRTRFDFKYEDGVLGLFSLQKKVLEVSECKVLHPSLLTAYKELITYFKNNPPPFKKASLRLRIAPDLKTKGLWMDLANVDIKNLLLEKIWLENLAVNFTIEIGQKRKRLKIIRKQDQHKLADPQAEIWFQTQGLGLLMYIGGFSQPSWFSADLISETIQDFLQHNSESDLKTKTHSDKSSSKVKLNDVSTYHANSSEAVQPLIEYGAGIGQYTIPLLQNGHEVFVYESDFQAIQCLKENASHYQEHLHINVSENSSSSKNKTQAQENAFQLSQKNTSQNQTKNEFSHSNSNLQVKPETALVNPPRSGLQKFAEKLIQNKDIKHIIYVSCSVDSLQKDLELLASAFKIQKITLVDQFQRTKHFETVLLLKRHF